MGRSLGEEIEGVNWIFCTNFETRLNNDRNLSGGLMYQALDPEF